MRPLPTAAVADACVRLGIPVRAAPLRAARAGQLPVAGRALPAQHAGSVDVFLEALQSAAAGDVLVVDNGGRLDEGCVGDLTALETRAAGAVALAVWGAHRDDAELARLGIPVWSLGTFPAGPRRLEARPRDALERARLATDLWVTRDDHVFADADGVLVVAQGRLAEVEEVARGIVAKERAQAEKVGAGETLWRQLDGAGYVRARAADPGLTFRAHLRSRQGAIEE